MTLGRLGLIAFGVVVGWLASNWYAGMTTQEHCLEARAFSEGAALVLHAELADGGELPATLKPRIGFSLPSLIDPHWFYQVDGEHFVLSHDDCRNPLLRHYYDSIDGAWKEWYD